MNIISSNNGDKQLFYYRYGSLQLLNLFDFVQNLKPNQLQTLIFPIKLLFVYLEKMLKRVCYRLCIQLLKRFYIVNSLRKFLWVAG